MYKNEANISRIPHVELMTSFGVCRCARLRNHSIKFPLSTCFAQFSSSNYKLKLKLTHSFEPLEDESEGKVDTAGKNDVTAAAAQPAAAAGLDKHAACLLKIFKLSFYFHLILKRKRAF